MKRNTVLRVFGLIMILLLLASMMGKPASAQDQSPENGVSVESFTASVEAPTLAEAVSYDSPPPLTEAQAAQIEWGVENMHRSPGVDKSISYEVAAPAAGTESVVQEQRPRDGAPAAPGDPVPYIWKAFGGSIPAGYKSNVMESSVDGKAARLFYTGNWFAARSSDKGKNWTYINAYADYPDFCCDQVILHDLNRDIYIWERLAVPNASGVNTFKLSIAFANPFSGAYWTYTFAPTGTNGAWTNQWWDYPHMQLSTNYLYIAWNMFNAAGSFVRTVMLRFPLDALAAGAGFSYNYYVNSDWFTFVPVSGASHVMYFASNWDASAPYDSLAIWRWFEDSAGLTVWVKSVPAWTPSGRGDIVCGSPNWMARSDMRLLTGARYFNHTDGVGGEGRRPGLAVLGWWWNVAAGGGFSYPYIDGAAFYEDTMTLVAGYPSRPYVYGSWCFSYPSFVANSRGDLGGVFNFSTGPNYQLPNVAYTIADDFWGHSPPGWDVIGAAGSSGGASDVKWGDYNTARAFQLGTTWLGAAHYIPTAGNCSNCSVPLYMGFGRERDGTNFRWW